MSLFLRLEITVRKVTLAAICFAGLLCFTGNVIAQKTVKPVLHGKHWVAVTGKPLRYF